MIKYDGYQKLISDSIRQLNSGLACYAYSQEQVDEICRKYTAKTGLELTIEKTDKEYIIRPSKRVGSYIKY